MPGVRRPPKTPRLSSYMFPSKLRRFPNARKRVSIVENVIPPEDWLVIDDVHGGRREALPRIMPSASPSDSDVEAWQTLPRDEQLRRLQASLTDSECAEPSSTGMSDILRRAGRSRIAPWLTIAFQDESNAMMDIYEFTERKFGRYQADPYHSGFERRLAYLPTFRSWDHRRTSWYTAAAAFVFSDT